jgi:hypothetical protein
MAQDRNINFILGKPPCGLPKTEPTKPVRNISRCGALDEVLSLSNVG